jgi:hypothetical protein
MHKLLYGMLKRMKRRKANPLTRRSYIRNRGMDFSQTRRAKDYFQRDWTGPTYQFESEIERPVPILKRVLPKR